MPSPAPSPAPYKSTPVFDETTLPASLRREHRTKEGVWGVIRVLEGQVRLVIADGGGESTLTPDRPGLVLPQQVHHVEPLSKIRMQVDFYDRAPALASRSAITKARAVMILDRIGQTAS